MFKFWKNVAREAFAETREVLGLKNLIQILIKGGSAFVIIAVLWIIEFKNALESQFVVRVIGTAFVVLLFPAVFGWKMISIPSKKFLVLADQIRQLKDARAPKLAFVWRPGRIFRETEISGHYITTTVRVGVRNVSTSITVGNVQVTVANAVMVGQGHAVDIAQALLPTDSDVPTAQINPLDIKYFTVASIRQLAMARNEFNKVIVGPFHRNQTEELLPQLHRLKLRISGENCAATEAYFRIGVLDDGQFVFEPDDTPGSQSLPSPSNGRAGDSDV